MEKNSIQPIASPYAATLSCSHCLYAWIIQGITFISFAMRVSSSVVYVFGGLVFHLAYEHSGGFYIRSLFRVAVGVASPVAVFGVADFVGQYAPVLGWGEVVRYVDGLGVRVVESLVPGLHRGDDDSFRVPPGFLL